MLVQELNERSRQIFRTIVETYMETGSPVGSRLLSKLMENRLSPASIRSVMSDLEDAGLLFAPHTSAGRLPTERGLRMFVDGLLEIGDLTDNERQSIEGRCASVGRNLQEVMTEATTALSGLSGCAGLVMAPKNEAPLKQVEFIELAPGRALVVIVSESGMVENRLVELPLGMTPAALTEASNFLSARLRGRTMAEAQKEILAELENRQAELNDLSSKVVTAGLAVWSGEQERSTLIVRGQANLLGEMGVFGDIERIRVLFEELEQKQDLLRLIDVAEGGQGVRIFIGSENKFFSQAGCAMVVAPFINSRQRIVGAIGVIGPTRINYARVIPLVDFTAHVLGRLIG